MATLLGCIFTPFEYGAEYGRELGKDWPLGRLELVVYGDQYAGTADGRRG